MSCVYFLFASMVLTNTTTQPSDRLNIVVICADALSPGKTGFEGNPVVKTPHLDRLAAEGVYFSRAYVAVPQTTGSRMSLLTGRYPHSTGVLNETDKVPTRAITFPDLLKRVGYSCGFVGTWKLPPVETAPPPIVQPETPTSAPASAPSTAPASAPTAPPPAPPAPTPPPKMPKPGLGFDAFSVVSDPTSPMENAQACVNGQMQTVEGYLPDWQTDQAIGFIRQFASKPFCLCLFYPMPSEPLHYPPGMEALYPPAGLPPKQPKTVDSKNLPPRLGNCDPLMNFQSFTDEQLRQKQSQYYAMVTRLDANVGRILHALDELRLDRNTLVVFTSAKGFPTGENAAWGTGPVLWEPFIRCPLVMRLPSARLPTTATAPASVPSSGPAGDAHKGRKMAQLVSLVDIAPTLLEAVGLTPPLNVQGHSMMRLLEGKADSNWPNECFVENDQLNGQKFGSRVLVTESFKLVDYLQEPDTNDQFFDFKRDPGEEWNLVNAPNYAGMVKAFRLRLERWRKVTRDKETQ